MSQLTAPPEVRTGRCSLILVIDGRRYRVSPAPPTKRVRQNLAPQSLPGPDPRGQNLRRVLLQ